MTKRKHLFLPGASRAVDEVIERVEALGRKHKREVDRLFNQEEDSYRLEQAALAAFADRRSGLRDAFAATRQKLDNQEAVFRLRVELDRALTALDAEREVVKLQWADRERQRRSAREQTNAARQAASTLYIELLDARLSEAGLAPWDEPLLRALRVLDGGLEEGGTGGLRVEDPRVGGTRAGALLRASEVVALFKERVGVSRSLFYARYRPLLRTYSISPTQLAYRPEGWVELVGHSTTLRFRHEEVEALIAFIGGSAA